MAKDDTMFLFLEKCFIPKDSFIYTNGLSVEQFNQKVDAANAEELTVNLHIAQMSENAELVKRVLSVADKVIVSFNFKVFEGNLVEDKIVAISEIIQNWQEEIRKFAEYLKGEQVKTHSVTLIQLADVSNIQISYKLQKQLVGYFQGTKIQELNPGIPLYYKIDQYLKQLLLANNPNIKEEEIFEIEASGALDNLEQE